MTARDHLVPVLGDDLTDALIAHRKAKRAPMTEHAGKLMAKKLATMADPIGSVEQTIAEGWTGVHHSTLEHNVWRAKAKLLTKLDFPTIMAIPTGALRKTVGQCKASGASAVAVAAHIASNRNEMREAVMLARDTIRMNVWPDPRWSLRRLREEHDRRARELAAKTANPAPWAPAVGMGD